jgi:uncharacterized membrane protein YagU involved in acid resistance
MIDAHAVAGRWSLPRTIAVAGIISAIAEMLVTVPVQSRLGVPPLRLFQSITGGWQSHVAYSGGLVSALAGILLHLAISFAAALVFIHASRLWPVLLIRPVRAGLVYGALAYAVMSVIAVPLPAVTVEQARQPTMIVLGLAVHLFLFGLPISVVNRFGASRRVFS